MTAGQQLPSFEEILDQSGLPAADEVISRRTSPWEHGTEGIEKACAESPGVFATRGVLPVGKLIALYGAEPLPAEQPDAHHAPLPGELALRLQQADTLSIDALRQLRRDLALWHHPDRHSPELHAVTSDVMKYINVKIDDAVRKRGQGGAAPA